MTRRRSLGAGTPVGISRRGFITGTAAAGAVAATGVAACRDDGSASGPPNPSSSSTTAPRRARTYLTPSEALLVEALTARILPGSSEDPGAREAEVVVYIDGLLASGGGYGEPVYRSGPFVTPGEVDPAAEEDAEEDSGYESGDAESASYGVVDRPVGTFDRYGDQSILTPSEVYRASLPRVDAHARERFGQRFLDLQEADQDAVLEDMEANQVPAFDDEEPTAAGFFEMLRRHTIEGMFSDPIYGGNKDMVGWQLIGWPAAQRAYTPQELITEGTDRAPQSLSELHHFNPGYADGDGPELPVAGSGRDDHEGHR